MAKRFLHPLRRIIQNRRISRPELFDEGFYLKKYADVASAGVDAFRHYQEHGASEGRKPHPLFDPAYYSRRNPGIDPKTELLLHFSTLGGAAGMSPHPLFDSRAYQRAHTEAAGANPLLHSMQRKRKRAESDSFATEGSQFGCAS